MTPPTLPPEAVVYRLDDHLFRSLRRAILAEAVPRIVEMARRQLRDADSGLLGWAHIPASILAALEKGEA